VSVTPPTAKTTRTQSKPGVAELLAKKVKELVPVISGVSGFMGYYVIYAPDDTVTSISIFNKVVEAQESNKLALELGRRQPQALCRRRNPSRGL
jgi:hypothetical protein